MSLVEILQGDKPLTVQDLQKFQREYDERFVSDKFIGFEKIRHVYAHLGKLFGRLAEYVQMREDGHRDFSSEEIKNKVVPDLLVYSMWLAREVGADVEKAYLERIIGNIHRLHSHKISPKELAELQIIVSQRIGDINKNSS